MKKKFLIGLLSTLCVTLSGCALGAFGQNNSESANEQDPSQMEQVYAQYVVYAQAEGQTPLSYEEWLATIKGEKGDKGDQGIQGEKGDKGDQGIQGEKGDKGDQGEAGKDGVSIVRVEIDENGDMYVVFSDNTKQKVDVSYTSHEHTFGEWTPFGDTENVPCQQRLASRICSTCSAIEWKHYEHVWQNGYTADGSYHWIQCNNCIERKDQTTHTKDENDLCTVCYQPINCVYHILNGIQMIPNENGTVYVPNTTEDVKEFVGYKATSCLPEGYGAGYFTCDVCNSDYEVITYKHNHKYTTIENNDGTIDLQITCTACNYYQFLENVYEYEKVNPTCQRNGYVIYASNINGTIVKTDEITLNITCHSVIINGEKFYMTAEVYDVEAWSAYIKEFAGYHATSCSPEGYGAGYFVCSECNEAIEVTTLKHNHE